MTSSTQSAPRTVQISIDTDANVLIENSDGKRFGLDFTSKKFVNDIPGARNIDRETSSTFILPYDKSERPFKIEVAAKPGSAPAAILSMTGPGFIIGIRSLRLNAGQIQRLTISSDGSSLSFIASEDGATPQLFLTTQSGRDKPSYRFEVASPFLSRGRNISVNLDQLSSRLSFKSDDTKKTSFSVMMRRTNPGGARDTYIRQNVSFGRQNDYVLDFGKWDGKADGCFHQRCPGCDETFCTNLKNEYLDQKNDQK